MSDFPGGGAVVGSHDQAGRCQPPRTLVVQNDTRWSSNRRLLVGLLFLTLVGLNTGQLAQAQTNSLPAENQPGPLRLLVPPVMHAAVGLECNVYWDNISLTLGVDRWAFDVHCAKGKQQIERWTFTPTEADVGEHPWELVVFNEQNERVAWARSRLVVSPMKSAATEPLTVLFVGDSLTHASIYPQRVVELGEQPGARRIQLIGTHVPGENLAIRHEGYGGWTAQRFATHFLPQARQGEAKLRGSPFLYKSEGQPPRLDFQRYCADANAGAWPDVVAIFLGPNDIFALTEETLEVGLDGILGHYDQLVSLFRDSNPRTKVAVLLPVPPAATQDAFGANYAAGQTRWQYKRNQHRMMERLRAQYETSSPERVFVVPLHLNLDCERNYPTATGPANVHAEGAIVRLNNGVHPAASGYRQIGDSIYAWLLSL